MYQLNKYLSFRLKNDLDKIPKRTIRGENPHIPISQVTELLMSKTAEEVPMQVWWEASSGTAGILFIDVETLQEAYIALDSLSTFVNHINKKGKLGLRVQTPEGSWEEWDKDGMSFLEYAIKARDAAKQYVEDQIALELRDKVEAEKVEEVPVEGEATSGDTEEENNDDITE